MKATDEELRKIYESSRSDYPVPAKTSYQISVVLQQDKVAATLVVSDAQLQCGIF